MEKTRFHTGMENLKKIDGKGGEAVIRSLETISPDLGKYIVEFTFGDIYERSGTLANLLTAFTPPPPKLYITFFQVNTPRYTEL